MTAVTEPLRAVVVDDTPDLRSLLCLALESSSDIRVVGEAGDGAEGIEVVRETRPDLVLLDLAMPVMDGIEALPHLRKLIPQAAIIVLSGFGAAAMADQALAAGANGYLQKGATPRAILDYIRGVMGFSPVFPGQHIVPSPSPDPARNLELRAPVRVPWDEAINAAPFAVLAVCNDAALTIAQTNLAAIQMLAPMRRGDSLNQVLPELAAAVANRDTTSISLPAPTRSFTVSTRRRDDVTFVYALPEPTGPGSDMLRRAIATTAHEMRTPVTVLLGVAETLREAADLSPRQWERTQASVERQARLLDSITSDLLTAASAHRGELKVPVGAIDLTDCLHGILADQPSEVAADIDPGLVAVADPVAVTQMVNNLLSNARKYGAEPIEVSAYRDGDEVRISVEDSGPGVPAEFRPRLFDEFTRAEGSSARGSGLGLYVVRSLARAQRGSATHAPRPGGGSQFVITLPISAED